MTTQSWRALIAVSAVSLLLAGCGAPMGGRATPGTDRVVESTFERPSPGGSKTAAPDPSASDNSQPDGSSSTQRGDGGDTGRGDGNGNTGGGDTGGGRGGGTGGETERGGGGGGGGLGIPIRIPLPADSLAFRLYPDAEGILLGLIREACADRGPTCVGVEMIVAEGPQGGAASCYQVMSVAGSRSDKPNYPYVEVPLHDNVRVRVKFICGASSSAEQPSASS